MTLKVLVVDDDPLVRSGLTMLLDGLDDLVVVGHAADGDEVTAAVDRHLPDVVLMDIRMARTDGIVATRRVRDRVAPPAVLVLTTFDTDENILRAIGAGASGFLVKDSPPERIVDAVRRVAAGESTVSPSVLRRLLERTAGQADVGRRAHEALDRLTDRERDVAAAVGRGESNAAIAAALHMGVPTVKGHVSSALQKLGLDNRTQLAVLAHEAGLLPG